MGAKFHAICVHKARIDYNYCYWKSCEIRFDIVITRDRVRYVSVGTNSSFDEGWNSS